MADVTVHYDGPIVTIQEAREKKRLGRFPNKIDAISAYDRASKEYFGESARAR